MTEDLLRELQQIQRYAAGMHSLLTAAQQQAPARAVGADSTGAVRVELGSDGLPEKIRAASGWKRRLEPGAFAAAVGEAFAAANAERMREWTDNLHSAGWDAEFERLRAGTGGPDAFTTPAEQVPAAFRPATRPPEAHASPRSLEAVTDDLLQAFRALDEHTSEPATPAAGTGSGGSGRLTITISMGTGVTCQVDEGWLARVDGTVLASALDEALAAARAELAAASDTGVPVPGLDQLYHEALGILADPERSTGS